MGANAEWKSTKLGLRQTAVLTQYQGRMIATGGDLNASGLQVQHADTATDETAPRKSAVQGPVQILEHIARARAISRLVSDRRGKTHRHNGAFHTVTADVDGDQGDPSTLVKFQEGVEITADLSRRHDRGSKLQPFGVRHLSWQQRQLHLAGLVDLALQSACPPRLHLDRQVADFARVRLADVVRKAYREQARTLLQNQPPTGEINQGAPAAGARPHATSLQMPRDTGSRRLQKN